MSRCANRKDVVRDVGGEEDNGRTRVFENEGLVEGTWDEGLKLEEVLKVLEMLGFVVRLFSSRLHVLNLTADEKTSVPGPIDDSHSGGSDC